jgi:hypothetical protein
VSVKPAGGSEVSVPPGQSRNLNNDDFIDPAKTGPGNCNVYSNGSYGANAQGPGPGQGTTVTAQTPTATVVSYGPYSGSYRYRLKLGSGNYIGIRG